MSSWRVKPIASIVTAFFADAMCLARAVRPHLDPLPQGEEDAKRQVREILNRERKNSHAAFFEGALYLARRFFSSAARLLQALL